MQIVTEKIAVTELKRMSESFSEGLVKAVVDVQQKIMAIDAELHSDLEDEDFVEFDSMINIRPRQNNRSRGVEDESLRKTILRIVGTLVQK